MTVAVLSAGRASDAAFLAAADVARIAADLGVDYRLVGGNAVTLLVEVHGVSGLAPPRETADADMGVHYEVLADPGLLRGLRGLGYAAQGGNRFVRTATVDEIGNGGALTPLELVIDVLGPSALGRLVTNQQHGDMVVDEVPGLALALSRPGTHVQLEVTLTTGEVLPVPLVLPDVVSALCLKTYAYTGRFADRDAADVWRLLEVARAAGVGAGDWGGKGEKRDTRAALHQHFGSVSAGGTKRATAAPAARARIAALVAAVTGPPGSPPHG